MPTTNPFFNHTYPGQTSEQSLLDDLVIEQIAMYGLDIIYMPRKMINLDRLLHESSKNVFEVGMSIPMYLKSFTGYANGMEILTKFGVRSSDEITLVMSRSQFTTYYSPFLKSYYNSIAGRPDTEELNHQFQSRRHHIESPAKELPGSFMASFLYNMNGKCLILNKQHLLAFDTEERSRHGNRCILHHVSR